MFYVCIYDLSNRERILLIGKQSVTSAHGVVGHTVVEAVLESIEIISNTKRQLLETILVLGVAVGND